MPSCSLRRPDSPVKNKRPLDTGAISIRIHDVLSCAPRNNMFTTKANTTVKRSSYTRNPQTYNSSNVPGNSFNTSSSTTTGRCIPPADRLSSTHHQSHVHPNYNTLTHPNQLFSAPYRPSPSSLSTQRGVKPPPSLVIPQAQNPPPRLSPHRGPNSPQIFYTQQGRYQPPGLEVQRGQFPVELHEAWYHRDSQHGCPGCVHERLVPHTFSRFHWPACPVSATREMAAWM